MSCLAGSSHYSVALLEARLLVCIPGGLASFHPGSSPGPVTAAMQSPCLPRSEAARQRAGRFVFLRWARPPAYLYTRFQVSKGCKRRSLTVMSGTRITRIPLDPTAQREGYLAGRRGIADRGQSLPGRHARGAGLGHRLGIGPKEAASGHVRRSLSFHWPFPDAPFPLVSIKPRPSRRSIENCVGPSAASSRQPPGADLASAGARRGPCIADASS